MEDHRDLNHSPSKDAHAESKAETKRLQVCIVVYSSMLMIDPSDYIGHGDHEALLQ